jgi:hypothetical protein
MRIGLKNYILTILFMVTLFLQPVQAESRPIESDVIKIGTFSDEQKAGQLPKNWTHLTFKNIKSFTEYTLVKKNGAMFLQAKSNASASALSRDVEIDPLAYPVIEWKWKIQNTLVNGNIAQKKGNDSPAQIIIKFTGDPKRLGIVERIKYETIRIISQETPPICAISYVWASKIQKNKTISNPYAKNVKMIVVNTGSANANTWIKQKRNIYQDYINAFGEKPSKINCITIMTDTDDTKESAISWFGDILFKKQ